MYSKLGTFDLISRLARFSSQRAHLHHCHKKALIYKIIIGHSSFCWFETTFNHFISLIAFKGFGLTSLKWKMKVFIRFMTLIPLKWKRTVLFCNLRFVKHVSPRKQCFLKILFYTTDCIHLKNMSFQNGLEKSIFSILTNQGTQQQQKNLGCLLEHKIFLDILFLGCCKHLKTFSIKCFWTSKQEIDNHIFQTSKEEVHTHIRISKQEISSFWTMFGSDPLG